ncbi:IS1182 family transposase [uncultured Pontibacter sp.]|uniref:IS1182 family transposase n=1 Tax=uncultured Pontibacter sp. TaxID=453356 RepID=UPI00263401D8|nr:IS1182 family transposase [uncultured Pontibacter sp.]
MQGRKTFEDERELRFSLSAHVPAHNFYRRLKDRLDLSFLYELTAPYYGRCGQHSIDPVVFFKLCLVAHLENISSDRKLIEHCSLRLDLLYFLGYQLDEPLPWHSTVSRTRQLLPVELFEQVFTRVLSLCADAGMVSGHTQVIDSALVKANASMGSLELKVSEEELETYFQRFRTLSRADRQAKANRAAVEQRVVSASRQELQEIKARNRKWRLEQDYLPGAHNKGAKYTSNKTHYSPVDPDARIAVKPGKARKLCYLLQLAVDTHRHVITHAQADHADRKDSLCLPSLLRGLTSRLQGLGLGCTSLLADTGYSSGSNYALLEREGIAAFIPPHGTYRGGPAGFTYNREEDYWLCPWGKKATFRKVVLSKGETSKMKVYYTTRKDCKGCPYREGCIGKLHEKRVEVTYYREEYERTITRIQSRWGRRMKRLRQATVEPVLGTLLDFLGMRRVSTRGLELAHKGMLVAVASYNLQKLLRFTPKRSQVAVMVLPRPDRGALFGERFRKLREGGIRRRIESRNYYRVVQQLPLLALVIFSGTHYYSEAENSQVSINLPASQVHTRSLIYSYQYESSYNYPYAVISHHRYSHGLTSYLYLLQD